MASSSIEMIWQSTVRSQHSAVPKGAARDSMVSADSRDFIYTDAQDFVDSVSQTEESALPERPISPVQSTPLKRRVCPVTTFRRKAKIVASFAQAGPSTALRHKAPAQPLPGAAVESSTHGYTMSGALDVDEQPFHQASPGPPQPLPQLPQQTLPSLLGEILLRPLPQSPQQRPPDPQAGVQRGTIGAGARSWTKANKKAVKKTKQVRKPPSMFILGQNSKLLGVGHVLLNVIRALNLIGLAAVMMASMVMPILSGRTNHFYFFDMATHIFVFLFATILFVSELPLPRRWLMRWFEGTWPVLGPNHSLAWLGVGMIFIGFQILGDLWKPAYVVETIGLEWWRAIVAASILSVTFGFFNIIASIIFRTETETGMVVTVRQIRHYGSLAVSKATKKSMDMEQERSLKSDYSPEHRDNWPAHTWSKVEEAVGPSAAVRRMTRMLNPMNFRKSRIQISKPIPQDMDDVERGYSSHSHGDRASPIIPDLQRPPTALHPAMTGGSHYSAAHMDRF
ncbi:hypothetical protein N657DRAFT_647287 [Parathielavia appendiculata]|uniref:DUF7598 domain-containing protein n=1 Tax=Parathielavia appendiculata TaxID=2587402 RepID=A0AAN6TXA8_9PEZI|nr:hypothetical protein N657DRAFT_647287 [Parathielavia appendiculata]